MIEERVLCGRCNTPVYRITSFRSVPTPINVGGVRNDAPVQVVVPEQRVYYEYREHHSIHGGLAIKNCPGCGGTFKESE